MYEKVDLYIDDYAEDNIETDREWSNYPFTVAKEMIEGFTDEDWENLIEDLPNKSQIWKKRLNDCLDDAADKNQQKALLDIAKTDDAELFVKVIDKLLDSDISSLDNFDELCAKAEEIKPQFENHSYCKSIINELLEKKADQDN